MAVSSRGRTELPALPKKWTDKDTSPERTKVWIEPKPKPKSERKVPVVYYLSRNGHLEHPHFMEVPLSSTEGLYLGDVINRLNLLRGNGMANMYSWSSKRSYKNGFVWHDLSDNDFIYPAHGQEYVLKGSELLEGSISFRSPLTGSSGTERTSETNKSSEDGEFPVVVRRRNQSWSSIDLNEYKVYKAESTDEYAGKAAADASTQTYERRRRRRAIGGEEEAEDEDEEREKAEAAVAVAEIEQCRNHTTELSREEISPPPSSSSPETLESLIKADVREVKSRGGLDEAGIRDLTSNNYPSGRMKASAVLMQLISCGSIAVKDCGAMSPGKDGGGGGGLSLISHYRYTGRLAAPPRGASKGVDEILNVMGENPNFPGIRLEDKEYFSGSLIETKKDEFPALKRSSSYSADRRSKLELAAATEEEIGVRARCIPRKPKTAIKKESSEVSRGGGIKF